MFLTQDTCLSGLTVSTEEITQKPGSWPLQHDPSVDGGLFFVCLLLFFILQPLQCEPNTDSVSTLQLSQIPNDSM